MELEEVLQDYLAGGGYAEPSVAPLAIPQPDPQAAQQARIDELIRTISQPDKPEMLPVKPISRGANIARIGLAGLGDLLTAIGFAKGGRIPPSSFLTQAAEDMRYRRAATEENARRTSQAGIAAGKVGAGLQLRDIQQQRHDTAAATERDYKDALDAAQASKVGIIDANGNPKSAKQLRMDTDAKFKLIESEKKARYAERVKDQEKRLAIMEKRLDIYRQKEARLAKGGGAGGHGMTADERAMKSLYDDQLKTERASLADLRRQRDEAARIFDEEKIAQLDPMIEDHLGRIESLIAERYGRMTHDTQTATPAPNGGAGWTITPVPASK